MASLLRTLNEKVLLDEEYHQAQEGIAEIMKAEDKLVAFRKVIYSGKLRSFLLKVLETAEPPIFGTLVKAFGKAKVQKEGFMKILCSEKSVQLTKRQAVLLWCFLESQGLVLNGVFEANENVAIVSGYTETVVRMQRYLMSLNNN